MGRKVGGKKSWGVPEKRYQRRVPEKRGLQIASLVNMANS
jgi:hypothetical protein